MVPDWPRRAESSGINIVEKSLKYAQFLEKQLLPDQPIYLKPSFEPKLRHFRVCNPEPEVASRYWVK